MRWTNDREKAWYLEAAKEYANRLLALQEVLPHKGGWKLDIARFESWLEWWAQEFTFVPAAFMRKGGNGVPQSVARSPVAASKPAISFEAIIDRFSQGREPIARWKAVRDTLEANNWKLREGETLVAVLKKIRAGSPLRAKVEQAFAGAE